MKKWRCQICGYIYVGERPPDVCPVCGAGPEFFEELEAETAKTGSDAGGLQEVLFQVPCGLFVVSCFDDDRANGMINNTVFQITDAPLQIVAGMDKRHLTTEMMRQTPIFAVNFLTPHQLHLVKRFGFKSGREGDKFSGVAWHLSENKAPLLDDSPGYLEGRIHPEKTMDAGTHWVFLAEVVAGKKADDAQLLTYEAYRSRKHELWSSDHD